MIGLVRSAAAAAGGRAAFYWVEMERTMRPAGTWWTVLLGLVVLWVGLPLGSGAAVPPSWEDLQAVYTYDPALPLDAEVGEAEAGEGMLRHAVRFDSTNDERVPAVLFTPQESEEPVGAVLLLHGLGGSKDDVWLRALAGTLAQNGIAAMAIDAQYHGERRRQGAELLGADLARTREAMVQTVVDNRRALDFLATRTDINPDRIGLLGASMGAILGTIVAAVDQRVCSACLVVGGGRWELLARQSHHPAAAALAGALATPEAQAAIGTVDPVNFIAHLAPRPVLMLNGRQDDIVPPECAQALFEAAQEPKEIVWYDGGHLPDPATAMTVLGGWVRETFGVGPPPPQTAVPGSGPNRALSARTGDVGYVTVEAAG